jgi:ribonuclease BN (tRNA processing enzyme)
MEFKFMPLICGHNGSGISSILCLDKIHLDQSFFTLETILINAGDSTLRAIQQYKLKMVNLKFILITSLAPHNTAGLPAILLALSDLGLEKIKILGCVGLKGLIDHMQPFVNRQYPVLDIIEVNHNDCSTYNSTYLSIKKKPCWVDKVSLICFSP